MGDINTSVIFLILTLPIVLLHEILPNWLEILASWLAIGAGVAVVVGAIL